MSKKGVYPHDHIDSFEKFNETKLPTKEQFYRILNGQHIRDDNYKHAKKIGEYFSLRTWVSIMISI